MRSTYATRLWPRRHLGDPQQWAVVEFPANHGDYGRVKGLPLYCSQDEAKAAAEKMCPLRRAA